MPCGLYFDLKALFTNFLFLQEVGVEQDKVSDCMFALSHEVGAVHGHGVEPGVDNQLLAQVQCLQGRLALPLASCNKKLSYF